MEFDRKTEFKSRYGYRWWDTTYHPLLALDIAFAIFSIATGQVARGIYLLIIGAVLMITMEWRRSTRRNSHN